MEKEIKRLKGENRALKIKNEFLRQRPDLPVDRIPAYRRLLKLEKLIEELRSW